MSDNVKLQVLLRAVDQASRPFKAVQAASRTLSGEIRGSQNELKELNARARQIEGFRKTSAQLAVTGNALEQAKAQAAALRLAFSSALTCAFVGLAVLRIWSASAAHCNRLVSTRATCQPPSASYAAISRRPPKRWSASAPHLRGSASNRPG